MTPTVRHPHHDLTFMDPLSDERAARLVAFLAERFDGTGFDGTVVGGTVLDVGCGWAEVLLRVLEAAPGARGTGVDTDEVAISHARDQAELRGLADRATLVVGDARTQSPTRADAVICIGASQVWGAPVELNEPVGYAEALAALRGMVERGSRVVYAEGIWSRPPTPAAIAPLAGRDDEMVTLAELVELAVAAGFAPVAVHEASLDEWDVFESGYAAGWAAWLAEHEPDHQDAEAVRTRAAGQRAAYLGGYRGVMGMAYLQLLAV